MSLKGRAMGAYNAQEDISTQTDGKEAKARFPGKDVYPRWSAGFEGTASQGKVGTYACLAICGGCGV